MKYSEIKQAIQESDKETVRDILDDLGEDVLIAGMDCGISVSDIQEAYQRRYAHDEEFTEQLLTDCGDIPKDLPSYIHIDWSATARDIMMDYSESNGYYFRNL